MQFGKFKDELELVMIQNPVESELYSLVAAVLRGLANSYRISLRDVSSRRTSYISARFKSDAGFPDFVVLERKIKQDADVLGAIEVKRSVVSLDGNLAQEQLNCHLEKFGKVVHTNGIVWRYYNDKEMKWQHVLGIIKDSKVCWCENSETKWKNLLSDLEKINWNKTN